MGSFDNLNKKRSAHDSQRSSRRPPIAVEASHGVHVFEVANYTQHRNLGIGSFLRSATFDVGGCAWSIRFYPSGEGGDNDEGQANVGLELMTKDAAVTVSFSMGLVDNATGARYAAFLFGKAEFDTRCVEGFKRVWCPNMFMTKTELEASTYLRDDRLMIECAMRVIKGTRVPDELPVVEPKINVPTSDLPDHLGKMLKEGEGTDLTIQVQEKSFPAHRMLLAARSPAFKAELLGPTKEGNRDRIAVNEIRPEVFEAFLYFIYTDSLPASVADDDIKNEQQAQMIRDLIIAADRYAMDRLKLVCEHIFSRALKVENVCDILITADTHTCNALKDACIEFIVTSNRMNEVTRTEGYARLKRDHPNVLIEVLDKAVKLGKI